MTSWATIVATVKDAGGWVGLIGGLTGFYTFLTAQWRRRLRVSIDYGEGNDAHESWHRFTITNRSDLPLTFRYIGPAWFIATPALPLLLNYATDMEDHDPPLTVLAARASVSWDIDSEHWCVATPPRHRATAYLKVGLEVPFRGAVVWIKPRRARNWDLSLREHWLHRLYGLYAPPFDMTLPPP